MSSDSGSWAPFGPGSGDDDDPSDPPKSAEPPKSTEPEAPAPPPLPFAPPTPPAVEPLPSVAAPAPLAWPSPTPPPVAAPTDPPPPEQQAPWPPQGFQDRKPVPSDATVALVLGIASIILCGFVGPFAVHYGAKARQQIDANPALGGRGLATWGFALGIISTALLVLLLILFAVGVISLDTD